MNRTALRRSLRIHRQMLQSVLASDPAAPRSLKRLTRLAALAPPYAALQSLHWLGFALDELLYSDYRDTVVDAPLFVVGIPRSGTTFVHRTLAEDPDFTSLTAWEAILAPSITERRVWQTFSALERRLGAPLSRSLNAVLRHLAFQLDDIHAIAMDDAEEDYLALLPIAGCFLLALGFPAVDGLWALSDLEEGTDDRERDALLDAYDALLKRHLYAHGWQHRLLSKNAAFATWTPSLLERYPNASFVVCVREPVAALSSQLSSIAAARDLFGTDPGLAIYPERFQGIYAAALSHLRGAMERMPERFAVVEMEALQRHPGKSLRGALTALGEPISGALDLAFDRVDQQARTHQSSHQHHIEQFNLTSDAVLHELGPDYRAIRSHQTESWKEVS